MEIETGSGSMAWDSVDNEKLLQAGPLEHRNPHSLLSADFLEEEYFEFLFDNSFFDKFVAETSEYTRKYLESTVGKQFLEQHKHSKLNRLRSTDNKEMRQYIGIFY